MTSRILVIDDDEATLELYREFLETEGFEPHLSLISFENLSEVAHLRPDLISWTPRSTLRTMGCSLCRT